MDSQYVTPSSAFALATANPEHAHTSKRRYVAWFLVEADRLAFFHHLHAVYDHAVLLAAEVDADLCLRLIELAKARTGRGWSARCIVQSRR